MVLCVKTHSMHKLTSFLLFIFCTVIYGQSEYELSGFVLDNHNESIAIGDVVLYELENNSPYKYVLIEKGAFLFPTIMEGNYKLVVSSLGFKKYEKIILVNKKLHLNIQLMESVTKLDEVDLLATTSMSYNKNGNLKVNVENEVFSSVPDPIELLSLLPNILVSSNREYVTVIGKGKPLLYIGNRRISFEELQLIPVDDISTIEIIRNPSAKYEASGRSVLLITKKINNEEGVRGSLSEAMSMKQNFSNYNSFNLSFKKRKLSWKTNLGYNDLGTWESHEFAFEIPKKDVSSDYHVLIDENDRKQIIAGTGLYYQINDTDYFSINTKIKLQTDDFLIDTNTFLKQYEVIDNIVTQTFNDDAKNFISSNLNYNKNFGANSNLFAGLQYSSFKREMDTNIFNNFNDTGFVKYQHREQYYSIGVLAYKLDYERIFKNELKWELGVNFRHVQANAISDFQFFESNSQTHVDYDYSEGMYASYSQLSGNMNSSISFNAGVRVERNTVEGAVEKNNVPIVDRDNTQFFPKAMLNIQLDSTKNITLNYARTIRRPNYSKASSISTFVNPFLEATNNVNLKPSLTTEWSASIQVKKNSLSVSYSRIKNPMYYTITYDDEVERAILSLKNLKRESVLDILLTIPITRGIWTATNTAAITTKFIDEASALNTSVKPYLYLYTNQRFKLRKNTTISFGGWLLTKRNEGIFKRNGLMVLNASITKKFFDQLYCSLRCNDIFKGMKFNKESYAINGIVANGVYYGDVREIALSLKYSFGKLKASKHKNKNVDDDLNRIR